MNLNNKIIKKLDDLDNEMQIWLEYIATINNPLWKPRGDGAKAQVEEEFREITGTLIKKIKQISASVVNYIYKE